MTTLPEALATLDALTCGDNSCIFAPAKRGGMGTNGGCQCVRGRPFIAPALAAVVKAARESVCRRARVMGDGARGKRGPGTITWAEHLEVWSKYTQQYGKGQSAEHIEERGGWGYDEAAKLLGRPLATWEPGQ